MDDNSAEKMHYYRWRESEVWRRKTAITLLFGMLAATFMFCCLVEFGQPIRSILQHKDKLLEVQIQGMQVIPDIQAKIGSLNDQMKALSSTSIETRLQTIETAINVGSIKPDQIATVEEMRKEIDTLKSYMFSDPKALVDLKQLEKDYGELNASLKNCPTKSDLETRINTTDNLIYLSWAFVAVIFAIIMWFGPKIWSSKGTVPTEPVTKPIVDEGGGTK